MYETEEQTIKKITAKFFHPMSAYTFYMVEYDPKDRLGFGYVTGTDFPEWGYVSMDELQTTKVMGIGIERDLHFGEHTIDQSGNVD